MKQLIVALIYTILLNIPVMATIIRGENAEYAGKELRFYKYSDPVTREKVNLFSLKIDHRGNFITEVDIGHISCFYCDFGIYRGIIILEPHETTDLLLPPLREKSFTESKNPYFKPVEFWFLTSKEDHLNNKISKFDIELNRLTDKYFNKLYINQSKEIFDSIVAGLNNIFPSESNEIFEVHKKLKLKSVEADAFRNSPYEMYEIFNSINPKYWNQPSFIELFDKTYGNKLNLEYSLVSNKDIKQAASVADIQFFLNITEARYQLKNPIKFLALLKMLHDSFYTGQIPEKAILKMISEDIFSGNSEHKIRTTSANLLKKLQYLSPGTAAPVICLKNINGENICTNRDNGKYKYLIFADTEMIICREQLKYLQKIEESFNDHLEIIAIIKKNDLIEMKIFLDKQKIPGMHLVDEKNLCSEKYQVMSFPQCFLLDKNHNVVFRQTKAPLDGFEHQFAVFIQKKLFEQKMSN